MMNDRSLFGAIRLKNFNKSFIESSNNNNMKKITSEKKREIPLSTATLLIIYAQCRCGVKFNKISNFSMKCPYHSYIHSFI